MAAIAIFLPTLVEGGAERAMISLAEGMCELGREVDLVVGSAEGAHLAEVSDRVRLVDLRARRLLLSLPGLARYLRQRRPACLYSALTEANIVALCARSLARVPVRIVPGLRTNLSGKLREDTGLKNLSIFQLARWIYPKADHLVAVSNGVADDAAHLLKLRRDRITVIPNPVITPELLAGATKCVEHPWFRNGEPPVVLACGRLTLAKDYRTLLRAFAALRQRRNARLVVLGDGEERESLQHFAAEQGIAADVEFLGFVQNPFRYMGRARVFVLSSTREGSPNVLVQALACGCAVVATDCPSGPREILAGVPGASLVPVGDVAALVGAIDGFLAPDIGRPGPRILPHFRREVAASAYLALAEA